MKTKFEIGDIIKFHKNCDEVEIVGFRKEEVLYKYVVGNGMEHSRNIKELYDGDTFLVRKAPDSKLNLSKKEPKFKLGQTVYITKPDLFNGGVGKSVVVYKYFEGYSKPWFCEYKIGNIKYKSYFSEDQLSAENPNKKPKLFKSEVFYPGEEVVFVGNVQGFGFLSGERGYIMYPWCLGYLVAFPKLNKYFICNIEDIELVSVSELKKERSEENLEVAKETLRDTIKNLQAVKEVLEKSGKTAALSWVAASESSLERALQSL